MDKGDSSTPNENCDTAHTGIFASVTDPFPDFWTGPGDEG